MSEILAIFLEGAVLLAIMDLEHAGGRAALTDYQYEQAREYCWTLGSEGDTLLFKTKGKTALNFKRLAESLAVMAFLPGGVKIDGLHFESSR